MPIKRESILFNLLKLWFIKRFEKIPHPKNTEKPANTPVLFRLNYYRFSCPPERGRGSPKKHRLQLETTMNDSQQLHQILVHDAKLVGKKCFTCLVFNIKNKKMGDGSFETFIIEDVKNFTLDQSDDDVRKTLEKFSDYDPTKSYFALIGIQELGENVEFIVGDEIPFDCEKRLGVVMSYFFIQLKEEHPELFS